MKRKQQQTGRTPLAPTRSRQPPPLGLLGLGSLQGQPDQAGGGGQPSQPRIHAHGLMCPGSTPAFCNGQIEGETSWACWKSAYIIPRGGERLETVGAGRGRDCAPSSLTSISRWSWAWRTSLTLLQPSQGWRAAHPLWQADLRPEEGGLLRPPPQSPTSRQSAQGRLHAAQRGV